jgi:hypothetical protein
MRVDDEEGVNKPDSMPKWARDSEPNVTSPKKAKWQQSGGNGRQFA